MSGYYLDEVTVHSFEIFSNSKFETYLNCNSTRIGLDTDWVLKYTINMIERLAIQFLIIFTMQAKIFLDQNWQLFL
jgi:hypothetical protein